MLKVPLAIGIGVTTLLVLCCLWWGVWKLRHCKRTEQSFATLEDILVDSREGLKKDVVHTFPIVRASDLNVDTGSKLQCPICWLAFRDADIMRQLPHCDHIFHRHCIDPVLEKQTTCPVCSIVLTGSPKAPEEVNGSSPRHRQCQVPLRSLYSDTPSSPSSPKSPTPTWVLVNRPVPLPRTAVDNTSSSSDRFEIELNPSGSVSLCSESPLLKYLNGSHEVEDWNDVDIDLEQQCIDISLTFGTDIPVEKRQHSATNEKGVDSFSFSTATGTDGLQEMMSSDATPPPVSIFRPQLRRSRGKESTSFSDSNPSTRFSRSTSRSSMSRNSSSDSSFQKFASWDYAGTHLEGVAEHLPLTKPPDECAFDVLPVITGAGSYASRDGRDLARVGSHRNAYAQL